MNIKQNAPVWLYKAFLAIGSTLALSPVCHGLLWLLVTIYDMVGRPLSADRIIEWLFLIGMVSLSIVAFVAHYVDMWMQKLAVRWGVSLELKR